MQISHAYPQIVNTLIVNNKNIFLNVTKARQNFFNFYIALNQFTLQYLKVVVLQ